MPDGCRLPPGIFACQSLEILKLDSNIEISDGADIPFICLPNLKLLHLESFVFTEDDFVTRLVSSCPVLEDLSITYSLWAKSDHLIISSHTLLSLVLGIDKCNMDKTSDLVLIDAPNLQYLMCSSDLPDHFSVVHLNALFKAKLRIASLFPGDACKDPFQIQLRLLKAVSDVGGHFNEVVYFGGDLRDQLPVFHNLRTLELGAFTDTRWDIGLSLILHGSPLLETLVFPVGLFESQPCTSDLEATALESEGWRTTHTIPSCCISCLKQIVLNRCFGFDRELNMIKFLLSKASVLKELVICLKGYRFGAKVQFEVPNLDLFESTVKELPRASNLCSVTVQR